MLIVKKFFISIVLSVMIVLVFSCVSSPKNTNNEKILEKKKVEQSLSPREQFLNALPPLVSAYKFEASLALFAELPKEIAEEFDIKALKLSILISAEKYKEATPLLAQLEKKAPKNLQVLYAGAMLMQAQNNKAKYLSYIKKILAVNPHDSWAQTEQGFDFYAKHKYPIAEQQFKKVLKKDANNIDALTGLAQVYYMQNKLAEEEKILDKALKQDPNNSDLMAERARVKSETKRMLEALDDIQRAIELDPYTVNHYIDLGMYCIATAKNVEAIEAFSKAIQLSPKLYIAYIYRAGLYAQMNKNEAAITDYRKIIKLYPQYYFAAEGLGTLLWLKNDWKGAGHAFAHALKYDKDNVFYAMMIALAYYRLDDEKGARKFMHKYIRTIDRSKYETEYFVARLFAEKLGGSDVHRRLSKMKDKTKKKRLMFYLGQFYDLINKPITAQAYYLEIANTHGCGFFEYQLNEIEINKHQHIQKKQKEK